MAYKFQLGSAILSGSTKFEEGVELTSLKFSGSVEDSIDIAADSILFRDADGSVKSDTLADYATAIAGDGLAASSGVLAVGVDDTGIEINSDALRLKDNGVTLAKMAGITRGSIILGDASGDPSLLAKGTAAQFLQSDGTDPSYVSISGDATVAAGGALTIAADAVEGSMLNDNVISGQTELAHADIASADELMISDGGTLKKVGLDSLRDHYYGQVSGDATVADGGALTIAANAVEDSMVNDNVATGLAGVGLSAASGVLALDSSELSDAAVASGDKFVFQDATDDSTKKESIDDIATFMAGSGLKAEAGVLEVRVSGSIVRDNDKIGLSGSIAGDGLKFLGGANSISTLEVDLNEMGAGAVALGADHFVFVDADDNITKKESFADFATAVAGAGLGAASGVLSLDIDELSALGGTGLHQTDDHFVFSDGGTEKKITFSNLQDAVFADVSGDATIAAGGALTIAAQAVENSMLADDAVGADELASNAVVEASIVDNAVTLAKMAGIARGSIISGDASGDPQALSVGSAHQFLQSDGTDLAYVSMSGDATLAAGVLSIGATKVTDAMMNDDVATGLAGTGLSAASGVLHARLDVASKADSDTLAAGVNYFADLTSDATVTLPASPSNGDVVIVKAKGLSSATITINKAGSQKIDNEDSVTIESPYGAVTMVYVASNDWRLV